MRGGAARWRGGGRTARGAGQRRAALHPALPPRRQTSTGRVGQGVAQWAAAAAPLWAPHGLPLAATPRTAFGAAGGWGKEGLSPPGSPAESCAEQVAAGRGRVGRRRQGAGEAARLRAAAAGWTPQRRRAAGGSPRHAGPVRGGEQGRRSGGHGGSGVEPLWLSATRAEAAHARQRHHPGTVTQQKGSQKSRSPSNNPALATPNTRHGGGGLLHGLELCIRAIIVIRDGDHRGTSPGSCRKPRISFEFLSSLF
ncbi:spidroin-1-like [Prinia subflava]|uniref:spidroin-1-like n=1 Tax=Prinia subflava TaxID=208062 RepID=UPI002FE07A40